MLAVAAIDKAGSAGGAGDASNDSVLALPTIHLLFYALHSSQGMFLEDTFKP